MREPYLEKVVVHMGVGQGGEPLADAEEIIEEITDQQSVRTTSKRTIAEFGIRKGDPIGVKVTLRGDAHAFLDTALELADISKSQFDDTGNLSFGVEDHTDFPSQEYDPNRHLRPRRDDDNRPSRLPRVEAGQGNRLDPVQTPDRPGRDRVPRNELRR